MKKKMVALLLVFAMTAAMIGCGNSTEQKTASSVSETSKQESTEKSASESTEMVSAEIDPFGAYEETVNISMVGAPHSGAVYPEGDDYENNIWTRSLKEKFNIEVTYDWVSDDYDTKLNLSIANGDLPDVFVVNESQLKQLMKADLVYDMNEIYDLYASDKLVELRALNEDIFATAMDGDALYGIPQLSYGDISQVNYIWIRDDWKNELGLADPETMDDIVKICEAFMAEYGSVGFYTNMNLEGLYFIAPAWQAYPKKWVTGEDGSIVYGSVQQEMKEALSVWAQWYRDGLINTDFAMANGDKQKEDAVTGKGGVFAGQSWLGGVYSKVSMENFGDEALFYPYEIPTATGDEVLAPITFSNGGYVVVNKNAEHPEAAIKILNYYVYMLYEAYADGVDFETVDAYSSNGMAHVLKVNMKDTTSDMDQYLQVAEALKTGDASCLSSVTAAEVYNKAVSWRDDGPSPDTVGTYLQKGGERCAYAVAYKVLEEGRTLKNRLWGSSPEVLSKYGSTLDTLLLEGFTKIIMGEENIDYFDTLVEEWKAAGGEEVTKAVNEAFGN